MAMAFASRIRTVIDSIRLRRERRRLRLLGDAAAVARFDRLRGRYADVVASLSVPGLTRSDGGSGYPWSEWELEIFEAFRGGVPRGFLSHRRINGTMVARPSPQLSDRIERVVEAFGPERAQQLLREDAVGEPELPEDTYLTSANRAHHAYHLATYRQRTGRDPWTCDGVVEWGGGYGDMARLFRRAAPGLTYVIVDLAPLLALQWAYLASLEGEEAVHLVTVAAPEILPGKVNLVESALVTRGGISLRPDLFLSTWAATESPPAAQAFLVAERFFGAPRLLLAYKRDASNGLLDALAQAGCDRVTVDALEAEGHRGHEYAFR